MRIRFALRLTGVATCLLASSALAQSWSEFGEAGHLPGTAQAVLGSGPLTQINGAINDPNDPTAPGNDRDMYLIQIDDISTFEATTTNGTTLDTQMFLFDTGGFGVTFNDDDPTGAGGLRSRITGQFVPAPGQYLLTVSTYNRDATSGGQLIWNNTPFNTERQPDGPGAAGAVDDWTGFSAFASIGDYSIFLTGASFVCGGFGEDFEGVTASAAGTILTGQAGYYIPPATTSVDFLAHTYAGNALGLPANPTGGANFIAGTGPAGGAFARAQKDITWPSAGNVTVGFDICGTFTGTLPSAQNLGSVSIQPFPGSQSLIALARWTDPATATNWNADFVWFDSAGMQLTEALPDPAFQNLAVDTWYHWAIDVSLTTNQVLQVRVTDIVAGTTASYNPLGRYLEGGIVPSTTPTGFRWFAGGGVAGNTLAFDNLCIQTTPHQNGFFAADATPVDLASVAGADDFSVTLNEDETYMIFGSNRPGGFGDYDLWETWRPSLDAPWAPPIPLFILNTPSADYEPNLFHLGGGNYELYFISTLPVGPGPSNIYVAMGVVPGGGPGIWLPPMPVPGNINGPNRALDDPYLTDDGLTMFYTGPGAGGDIHTATRPAIGMPWADVGAFAPATSAAFDHSPVPEANGNILWFSSNRPGGSGGQSDLYMIYLDDNTGTWSAPTEVTEFNTADWESNMWRRGKSGRFYISRFLSGGARIFTGCYQVPSVVVREMSGSIAIVDSVIPRAVPDPWTLPQPFQRRWEFPIASVVTVEHYDWRPPARGGLYILLISGIVPGPQPLLPGLEQGTFMLDPIFLATQAIATGDAEGFASIRVQVPNRPVLSGKLFSMQSLIFNVNPQPGEPILLWSEPSEILFR